MSDILDFASGIKHKDILLHLLEHHIDELDPGYGYGTQGCQDFSDQFMTYTHVMNETFPFPVRCLQTGSVPENVCLPDAADKENHLFAFMYYPEGDLMVVIKPKHLTQGKLVVRDIPGSPGFVRVELEGDLLTTAQENEEVWDKSVSSDMEFQSDIVDLIDSADFRFLFIKEDRLNLLSAKRFVDMFYMVLNTHFTCIFKIWKSSMEDFPLEVLENEGFVITRHGPALDMVLKSKFNNFSLCTLPPEGVSELDSDDECTEQDDLEFFNQENDLSGSVEVKPEADNGSNNTKTNTDEIEVKKKSEKSRLVTREVINLVGRRTVTASPLTANSDQSSEDDLEIEDVRVITGDADDNLPVCDYDVVPAIRLPDWPAVAQEWITRNRLWPSKDTVQHIVGKGVLLVAKPPQGGNPLTDWRLSFSEAEVELMSSKEFPCRQQAYRIFKYMVKTSLSNISVISSYHLKTILLWVSEKLPQHFWAWENLSHCYLGMYHCYRIVFQTIRKINLSLVEI